MDKKQAVINAIEASNYRNYRTYAFPLIEEMVNVYKEQKAYTIDGIIEEPVIIYNRINLSKSFEKRSGSLGLYSNIYNDANTVTTELNLLDLPKIYDDPSVDLGVIKSYLESIGETVGSYLGKENSDKLKDLLEKHPELMSVEGDSVTSTIQCNFILDGKDDLFIYSPLPNGNGIIVTSDYVKTKSLTKDLLEDSSQKEMYSTTFPTNGIWEVSTISTNHRGMVIGYKEKTLNNGIIAVHQERKAISGEVSFFLDNIELYSKFNQIPFRKLLVTGEPGSGKSTILANLANEHKDTKPVFIVTTHQQLKKVLETISENATTSAIIIWDECVKGRGGLGANGNSDSEILNLLDGYNTPKVTNGVVLLMTTNYPEAMDPRISKRPGRIDKVFSVNGVDKNFANELFLLYFKDFMVENNFDYTTKTAKEAIQLIATGMTGAQIKELFNSYVSYLVSNNKKFDIYEIGIVKEQLFESFNASAKAGSILDFDKNSLREGLRDLETAKYFNGPCGD